MNKRRASKPTASAIDDEWQRQATAAAIAAVRNVVKSDGAIQPNTPIGCLSDVELGWIVAAVMFAWISKRAEQATSEKLDTEFAIRVTDYEPDPWDAGAVAIILPKLAEVSEVDWSQPLNAWSRQTMIKFLTTALNLIRQAITARDAEPSTTTTPYEFDDPIGI